MHGSLCIAKLLTRHIPTAPDPLWVRIPPMSTYIRVLCYRLNHHRGTLKMYSALRPREVTYQYVKYPMHCCAKPGVQYNCESIQVTISGDTSRCQWACHQFSLTALACSVCWSLPTWCAPLANKLHTTETLQDGIPLQAACEAPPVRPVHIPSHHTTESLGYLSMFTLASVADPRLV